MTCMIVLYRSALYLPWFPRLRFLFVLLTSDNAAPAKTDRSLRQGASLFYGYFVLAVRVNDASE